jgi:UDP-2,3-diacylglucosamine hydrolase
LRRALSRNLRIRGINPPLSPDTEPGYAPAMSASTSSARTLGIIAGGGPLPGRVAAAAAAAGRRVFIVGLDGFADPRIVGAWPNVFLRMGAAGQIIAALKAHACEDLVLIGPVRRPSFLDLRPDGEGAKLLARIGRAAFAGDDGLLKAVIRVLGEEGFQVLGAHEILNAALGPQGLLSRTTPDATAMADIARGVAVTRALGAVDVGQGCVVRAGVVIAVEAVEGTDAMLQRCGPLLDALGMAKPAGVLVKSVKPGQDRRADLPTIGPDTLRRAAEAGLAGIAYEGGGTILAERETCIALADELGLFLIGYDPDGSLTGNPNGGTTDKRS